VLGYEQWRAVEQRFGLGAIQNLLALAVAEGTLPPQPLGVTAPLLLAAVDEAALFIAYAEDQGAARDEAVIAMDRLLAGLTGAP
jgi:hypothetical protein